MKRIATLLLTGALLLTIAGCGGQKKDSQAADSSATTASQESSQKAAVPVKESPEKKESSKKEAGKTEESKKQESKKEESKKEESKKEESKKEAASAEESSEEEKSTEADESSREESAEESREESSKSSAESAEESSEEQQSSEKPKPKPVISGEAVEASWFDDAVFVGDSVTLKLSYYADNGSVGNATFLCAGSLGYNNAQMGLYEEGNVHPVLNGETVTVVGGLSALQPKKILVMLGMNDIGLYGVDGAIEGMKTLTAQISQSCPNAVIYIQSVTPMLTGSQLTDLNNRTIAEFDSKLQPICQERGYIYLDVASAVEDGSGSLIPEYCGDPQAMGLHFSDAGCEAWVSYLKTHVE